MSSECPLRMWCRMLRATPALYSGERTRCASARQRAVAHRYPRYQRRSRGLAPRGERWEPQAACAPRAALGRGRGWGRAGSDIWQLGQMVRRFPRAGRAGRAGGRCARGTCARFARRDVPDANASPPSPPPERKSVRANLLHAPPGGLKGRAWGALEAWKASRSLHGLTLSGTRAVDVPSDRIFRSGCKTLCCP